MEKLDYSDRNSSHFSGKNVDYSAFRQQTLYFIKYV